MFISCRKQYCNKTVICPGFHLYTFTHFSQRRFWESGINQNLLNYTPSLPRVGDWLICPRKSSAGNARSLYNFTPAWQLLEFLIQLVWVEVQILYFF